MLIHRETKKVVLNVQEPARVTTVIPTAKVLTYKGHDLVVVPHNLDNTKVLRSMGLKVPSPIEYYYNWSGRYAPFKAQFTTSSFLTTESRAFVLNDMGTGKTLATLWAFDYLRSVGLAKKLLIVSPLSTLERTWADEVFTHFPHLTVGVLYGSASKRRKMLNEDFDIYIVNHDGVKVVESELVTKEEIDTVVVDEIATFRNASTSRWKSLNKVCANRPRVWGLTGTPTPNAPTDAWGQCRIICPQNVPPYFGRFRDTVMRQRGPFKWEPRDNAVELVANVMQPSIRFRRDECVDLPPAIYQTRAVPLSAEQETAYKEMKQKLAAEIQQEQVVAINEAVKLSKLLQICCIAEGTPVLTRRGWVRIESVTATDEVWDGEEWVSTDGATRMGVKPVVSLDGVLMTRDHRVLTTSGWAEAQECIDGQSSKRLNRVGVRIPHGYSADGDIEKQGEDQQVRLVGRGRTDKTSPTYDLINCGPRSRFVVRGESGQLMIVHNCGTVYGPDGAMYPLDVTGRTNEVIETIEQADSKVLVFVPFTGALNQIAAKLAQHWEVGVIHGGTPKHERDRIFHEFQKGKTMRVLVANPGTLSHGLTLTAANTIVWFGPPQSAEQYEQANARVTRPGQKHTQFIVHIEGTEVERRVYARLRDKRALQGLLLDVLKGT